MRVRSFAYYVFVEEAFDAYGSQCVRVATLAAPAALCTAGRSSTAATALARPHGCGSTAADEGS